MEMIRTMPKNKLSLSKRHEKLIDICVNIPSIKDISLFHSLHPVNIDKQSTVTYALIDTIRTLSKKTQYEDICEDIIKKSSDLLSENL